MSSRRMTDESCLSRDAGADLTNAVVDRVVFTQVLFPDNST